MPQPQPSSYIVHQLLRARDWQHRPQFDEVCKWWRDGGRGVLALFGMGGAGKTAIAERFLRVLPGGLPEDPNIAKDATLRTSDGVFVFSFYDAPNSEAFFEAVQMWLEDSAELEKALSLQQLLFKLQRASGLMVLDGLEKVQEDGVRGLLGRLDSPKLREFLDRIAAGYVPDLSVLVTSRFPLADLRDARPQFFRSLPIDEIELPAGIELLRARGVRGTDLQLQSIVEACGRHALTVDFAGGYVSEFGGGDPTTTIDFKMDSAELHQKLDDEPDESRRHVLKQGQRFARLAERYRDAMLGNASTGSQGDAAALALLQRICLFRLGVDVDTLANIFTGEKAISISGSALAALTRPQLQKKLDWLVRMRIVEASAASSSPKTENVKRKTVYTIHPAVRDGFLSGIGDDLSRENHGAIRQGLEVSLGQKPGRQPSEPATLDLLEEIVFHTIQVGHVVEAWQIYKLRLGGEQNLDWRLAQHERGRRIVKMFQDVLENSANSESTSQTRMKCEVLTALGTYEMHLGELGHAIRSLNVSASGHLKNRTSTAGSFTFFTLACAKLLAGRAADVCRTAPSLTSTSLSKTTSGFFELRVAIASAAATTGLVSAADKGFNESVKSLRNRTGPLGWNLSVFQADFYRRIGRFSLAAEVLNQNQAFLLAQDSPNSHDIQKSNLLLAEIKLATAHEASAKSSVNTVEKWLLYHREREVECWFKLVLARIERACNSSQISKTHTQVSMDLRQAIDLTINALKIARDCGYGLLHIDLLLEQARLHLLCGNPQSALDDLLTALDEGVPADEQTGQPELLAATHPECGYAWAIAEGLQLRGEALLLQAAQLLGTNQISRNALASGLSSEHPTTEPDASAFRLMKEAKACLNEALNRWEPLHDPEPERPDQNFQLDGKPYNYLAAETHRVLTALDNGVLTRLPIGGQRKLNSPKPPIGVQLARERIAAEKRRSELANTAFERAKKLEDAWRKLRYYSRETFHDETGLDPDHFAFTQPPAPAEYWLAKADLVVAIGRFIHADPYWPTLLKSLDPGDEWKQTALAILDAGISGQRDQIADWLSDLPSLGTVGSHDWPGNLVGAWLTWRIREELTSADHDRIFEPEVNRSSTDACALSTERRTPGVSAAVPSKINAYNAKISSGMKSTLGEMECSMNHCKVLFLAANPLDCTSLQLDEEARAIEQRILQTNHRDAIDFVPKFAVRRDDLQLHLNKEQPHVLHFSGHGSTDEIAFKGDDGNAASVSKAGLKAMLKAVKDNIRLVVLNACYTQQQADSITDVIDCAIGMKRDIGDEAARVFAASFYLAIGFGRSVQNAFDQAVAALHVMGIPEQKTPVLSCREGIDAATVFLVDAAEKLDETDRKFISAIEFILDRPLTEFNESLFKSAFQEATGIDARLIRIASIRSGSTIVRIQGEPEILTQAVNKFRESQESLHRFAQLTGLSLLKWSIDGTNYELSVGTTPTQDMNRTNEPPKIEPIMRDAVFISYSHKDKKFLDELLTHLKPMMRTGSVNAWSDREIAPGSKWFDEIRSALARSSVVVMLVTPHFLASDFIHEHELGPTLKEAQAGGVKVLWVLIRDCSYAETTLSQFQAIVSPPSKALALMRAERDTAWKQVCEAIKSAANPK